MASKTSERLKALQERAASLVSYPDAPAEHAPAPVDVDAALTAASAHFGGTLEQLVRDRTIQRIPTGQIAPDTRPAMSQPRFLPLPEQLLPDGQPVLEYQELVAELLTLGASLRERQIQPIVVFAGNSSNYPAANYLILVGQRRWTAACLVGLERLDAVVVAPPTPSERVLIQYAENEAREEFSDMERAWSLQQMKQALQDAPWEEVETRLQMSRARRQQLLRLMAFTPEQQRQVALLRLQETQSRTLHTALRSGELTPTQVDGILERLAKIATDRSLAMVQAAPSESSPGSASSRRLGIDGPTVARLVARARRAVATAGLPSTAPRWLAPLREQIQRTSQGLQRSLDRAETLDQPHSEALRADLSRLQTQMQQLLDRLAPEEQL